MSDIIFCTILSVYIIIVFVNYRCDRIEEYIRKFIEFKCNEIKKDIEDYLEQLLKEKNDDV